MALVIVIVIVVVLALVAIAIRLGRSRRPDGVDSFRRQIDALSPEARRPTIDQMKPTDDPADDDDGAHGT